MYVAPQKPHRKQIILADVNIPYKFSLDRQKNKQFFCINADKFSDQSFQSVVLDLNTEIVNIVPNIRNGFASAVDQNTGTVYLGGSDGIYQYNYQTQDINRPAILKGIDIFDMYFKDYLYFVETTNLDLYELRNNKKYIVSNLEEYGVHHFVIDSDDNIILANPGGLFYMHKNAKTPIRFSDGVQYIRGMTTDTEGNPYVIAKDGIYMIDTDNEQPLKLLTLNDGYGIAFDKDNNILFSDERTVVKLVHCK
ncbi:ommochrome-binding protein-like [Melitaea cinxia]|uniref:ommochrome-binding protein-like n=1 Tax=Melitaea cinxia TaxID=113334 RepID=UPI001E272B15|nr:ommochrome-binding protein-like [Melitaea cinxia]